MSDKSKKGGGGFKGRPPQDRGPRRGPAGRGDGERGDRPVRARRDDGDRPVRSRPEREDRPARPRPSGGDKPFRPRPEGGERPFRARRDDDRPAPRGDRSDRPARPRREDGDKPFRPRREEGDRPFRARRDDDRAAPRGERSDRPARPRREDGDKPFRLRREEGDRPFRARRDDDRAAPRADRSDRPARPRREDGDKPFRPRREEGDRPFRARRDDDRATPRGDRSDRPARPRREDGDKPFRPRREEGDRPFRARRDDDRATPRGDRSDRPARPRREDGDKPFRPRREEGDRPFRPRREDDRPAPRADRPFRPRREDGDRPARPRREDENRSRSAARSVGPRKEYMERVAKVIARAGLCSRRDAEAWIDAGRVAVNGEVLASPARDVGRSDKVTVDGTPLPSRERTRLFLYHKPRGLVTTARDPEGRTTVFESLPAGLPRVITVGRLDINTEGLLLLTNDGGLSRVLELPETGWLRRYRVRAFGEVTQADLNKLAGGVVIDDMHYGPVEAEIDREQGDNVWLTLGLREGKNREVKRILEHLGLQVNRLIRISFGPFQLQDLPEGAVEEVTTRVLADQLGQELAEQAEVDFEAPVFVYEEDDFRPKKPAERRPPDDGERAGRAAREDRPRRDFGGDRPTRRERDGDAPRGRPSRDEAAQGERPARPPRRHPTEVVRSVWRAEDENTERPKVAHVPRRGADPKAARTESAGREHVRAGKVTARSGRAVLVEKVARDPAAASVRDTKPKRGERPARSAWSDEDRPARPPREGSERPARGDDRPKRPRPDRDGGDRPSRPRGERPGGGGRPGGFGGKGGSGRPPRGPRRDG